MAISSSSLATYLLVVWNK